MTPNHLLIAWHSRTGASEALAAAAARGAGSSGRLLRCEDVGPADILAASGYLFVCPENLATMSGAMKEMFDRCYYPVLGRIEGRPYTTVISAGSDGQGAERQLDRIATGWRLKRIAEGWIINTASQTPEEIMAMKSLPDEMLERAKQLGRGMAEALKLGIY